MDAVSLTIPNQQTFWSRFRAFQKTLIWIDPNFYFPRHSTTRGIFRCLAGGASCCSHQLLPNLVRDHPTIRLGPAGTNSFRIAVPQVVGRHPVFQLVLWTDVVCLILFDGSPTR